MSERQHFKRLSHNDAVMFRKLYNRYARLIYRYILVRSGKDQAAKELTTRVFIEAWQTFPSFNESDTSLGGPLFQIAHKLLNEKHRRWRLVGRLLAWWKYVPILQDGQPGSIGQALQIREALLELPFEEDVTLHLHVLEGYTLEEIGKLLRKSPAAIRLFKLRAFHQMRGGW